MVETAVSPSIRSRLTATIFLSSSLFAAAQIASFTLMPIVAADLSGTEGLAGAPSTLSMIGRVVVAYPVGWLMGRAGRRLGLSLGFLLGVLGAALSAMAIVGGSFWGFAFGVGLAGSARGATDLGRFAAAEVYPADRRAKIIGLIVFAGTIGAIGGPLLVVPSAGLMARYGLPADAGPYVFGAILTLLSLLLIVIFLRPDPLYLSRQWYGDEAESATQPGGRSLGEIFSEPRVRLGVGAMMVGQLVMTLIMVITPLHMDHAGHGRQSISLVIMSHTLGMFGLSWLTGWLIDRAGSLAVIVAGAAILVASSILTPLAGDVPALAFALFLLGLGWNFCFIAGSSLLTGGLAPEERSRTQGTGDMLSSAAAAVGSLGTGLVFARAGMTAVGAVGLAFSLTVILSAFWYLRQRRTAVGLG